MHQFGRISYVNDKDYALCMDFIDNFKKSNILNSYNLSILQAALNLNPVIGKAALIYIRLYFWGKVDKEILFQNLQNILTNTAFENATIWEQQEIYNCLGTSLLSNFISNINLYEVLEKTNYSGINFNEVDYTNEKIDSVDVWCYAPPPTGFFSIIENIIYAKFFCLIHKKIFKLDISHNWWRYPVPFFDLFENYDWNEFNLDLPAKSLIRWDVLRFGIEKIHNSFYQDFAVFKYKEYIKIKNSLKLYSDSKIVKYRNIADKSCIVYVRGGDKILIETIPTPTSLLVSDIDHIRSKELKLYILSDDYKLADLLIKDLDCDDIENITEKKFNGYYLNNNSIDDVNAIVSNYLLLSNVNYSIGCPSSNLVNSAHWSNNNLNNNLKLKSIPTNRYLYL